MEAALIWVIPAVTLLEVMVTVGFTFSGSGWISLELESTEIPSERISSAISFLSAVSFLLPKVTRWLLAAGEMDPE